MAMTLAVITIIATVAGVLKILHSISNGFSNLQTGQAEMKEDLTEVKGDVKDLNTRQTESEKDIVHIFASTKTPPRKPSS